jgi:hypothetical protein
MAILNQIPTRTIPLSKAKYTKNERFQVGSPVHMVGYFTFKETDASNIITVKRMSFGFRNESTQPIAAIRGVFTQQDAFGDELGELKYSLVEMENYTPGSIQGERLFMDVNLSTTSISFRIEQVIFADGSKWIAEQFEYITIDIQRTPIAEADLNTMKYAWFLVTPNFPINNHYTEDEHFYACPCGNINTIDKTACSLCKTPKEQAIPFKTTDVAGQSIQNTVKKVFDDFNTLFPDAIIKDSASNYRFNDNAVLFDPAPLKKLRDFATQWKGVNPIVKDEIKKHTTFIPFIEDLKNRLLKTENDQKLKAEAEKKAKTRKQRIKLLTISILSIVALALIGVGVYYGIYGKLAFENRNTYDAQVTFTKIDSLHTRIDIQINDIDFSGSKFEFYGVVFDNWCTTQFCYDEIIMSPNEWDINITNAQFTATAIVNLPINGMQANIKHLEFNSEYFTKHIYVPTSNVTRYN